VSKAVTGGNASLNRSGTNITKHFPANHTAKVENPFWDLEPKFSNVYGAQESIPRNEFRQLM